MDQRLWMVGGVMALAFALASGAVADERREHRRVVEQQLGADLIVAGGSYSMNRQVAGDLIAVGGSFEVDAPVAGDVLAFGGNLRIDDDVGRSVYAAGGKLRIAGTVGHNLRLAGGRVDIGPKARIEGNLSAVGGEIRLRGAVGGYVQAAGGQVLIDGPVGGDVVAVSRQVELGPNARIAGKLRYRSGEALQRDPAAQVAGGVEPLPSPASAADRRGEAGFARLGVAVAWALGMMLLAAVLVAAAPHFAERVTRTLRARPGMSLLIGFAAFVGVPLGALVLMVTVIGLPLGMMAFALYLAVLPMTYASGCVAAGGWALRRWHAERAAATGWRIVAAVLAVLLMSLLAWLPLLGVAVNFAVLLAGLGAWLLQLRGRTPLHTPAAH